MNTYGTKNRFTGDVQFTAELGAEFEHDYNAAAPDMLTALRVIEQRLAPCAVYGAPATCDAVALARAAIAKAESK